MADNPTEDSVNADEAASDGAVPDRTNRDNVKVVRPDAGTLQIERSIPAEPERVWLAFTDPARLAAWFWPPRLQMRASVDPEPGGTYRIESSTDGRAMAVGGVYEVVRPDRLVFSWRWDGEDADPQTLVTVELSGMDDGTWLVLTHERFPDQASRDDHVVGWTDCLDRLPGYLAQQR